MSFDEFTIHGLRLQLNSYSRAIRSHAEREAQRLVADDGYAYVVALKIVVDNVRQCFKPLAWYEFE